MEILVTGGAGYIGSHTCIDLLAEGYKVVVLDNLSNSQAEVIKRVEKISGKQVTFYEGNILDSNLLKRIFDNHQIEAVIHFAGLKAVGESVANPLDYYHNNVVGTINLCQSMKEANVKKLIFSSSATIYSADNVAPYNEDMPQGVCSNPYGTTKSMIETILTDLSAADSGWQITALRYFNPLGAHESGLIGEDPHGIPNNLMPYITQVAVGKLSKLRVFGNDYETRDGTCIRDYIHVSDLASGHLKAIHNLKQGITFYNLGNGKGYTVLEIVNTFTEVTGIAIPYEVVERRSGDLAVSFADVNKAYKDLQWKAKHDLATMCRDSWRWQSQNPNGIEKDTM